MLYEFNPGLPEPFNVIHPYQLKKVNKLLSLEIPEEVDYILLFGGSLDLACHKNSDLDLYIISQENDLDEVNKKMYHLCKQLKIKFDLLISDKDTFIENANELGTVEYDIKHKGVCIYAKK